MSQERERLESHKRQEEKDTKIVKEEEEKKNKYSNSPNPSISNTPPATQIPITWGG